MILRKITDLFTKTSDEMTKMNNEYEEMKSKNKVKSVEIRSSIQSKSEEFQARKKERDAMFNVIRNK